MEARRGTSLKISGVRNLAVKTLDLPLQLQTENVNKTTQIILEYSAAVRGIQTELETHQRIGHTFAQPSAVRIQLICRILKEQAG